MMASGFNNEKTNTMKYPTNIPLSLNDTRVARSYVGGSLINKWKGLPDCGETDKCEEWQMSVIEEQYPGCKPGEGLSRVENILNEPTLKEVIASSPLDYLGKRYCAKYGNECGLGVRTGDSVVRLSLQAHPRPVDAKKYLNFPLGKTEAWYIVETRTINGEHPYVRIGFKKGYTKEKIREMFYNEDIKGIEESLHKILIDKGSVILVPAGTPHAMGPGAMFLELADACDFTFKLEHKMPTRRLLDTEMHYGIGFDNMLECIDYTTYTEEEIKNKTIFTPKLIEKTSSCSIFKCFGYEENETFTMYKYVVNGSYILKKTDHYRVIIPIYGNGSIKTIAGDELTLKQGSGIFLPQSLEDITITGNFSFILSDCAEL